MCQVYGRELLQQTGVRRTESLLDILLMDRTTQRNIIWATADYSDFGIGYAPKDEIQPAQISGKNSGFIQSRVFKAFQEQYSRTREKAEVFTPSWICNEQNNLIDSAWFGRENVFNAPESPDKRRWRPSAGKVEFPSEKGRDWKHYVDANRMEMACGEAPYLVSCYDTVSGDGIPIENRIGLLDRKLRIVNENAETEEGWLHWACRAFQSVYGFEYQGDNLFLARENLFATFVEYYHMMYRRMPDMLWLYKIATVISWNLWQMDGQKCVVPRSCYMMRIREISLFGEEVREERCPGCQYGDIRRHNGAYCNIKDWRGQKIVPFISLLKGGGSRAII